MVMHNIVYPQQQQQQQCESQQQQQPQFSPSSPQSSREQLTPPLVHRLSSSILRVSTPPNLEPVLDSSERKVVSTQPVAVVSSSPRSQQLTSPPQPQQSPQSPQQHDDNNKTQTIKYVRLKSPLLSSRRATPGLFEPEHTIKPAGIICRPIKSKSNPALSKMDVKDSIKPEVEPSDKSRREGTGLNVTFDETVSSQKSSSNKQQGMRKVKSSPALISEAVKDIPVRPPQPDQTNDKLVTLITQLAQDTNLLATLPSPFRLQNTPPSPIYTPGEMTPPPGLFAPTSPPGIHFYSAGRSPPVSRNFSPIITTQRNSPDVSDKRMARYSPDNRDVGGHSSDRDPDIFRMDKLSTTPTQLSALSKLKVDEEVLTLSSKHLTQTQLHTAPATTNLQQMVRHELRKTSPELAGPPSLSPLNSSGGEGDSFLSQEHVIAMGEVDFLLTFAETVLLSTNDLKLSSYVNDLMLDLKNKHSHLLPSVDGQKCTKLLLTLEALRVASYALKFSQMYKKKGTLESTKSLGSG